MIITDSREKIKDLAEKLAPHEWAIFGVLLVVVSSLLGLGLYRLGIMNRDLEPITIERGLDFPRLYALEADSLPANRGLASQPKTNLIADTQLAQVAQTGKPSGEIVASKNGTKYYFTRCSGVKRIKEANKVYFTSEQEAVSAGYSKAANCN